MNLLTAFIIALSFNIYAQKAAFNPASGPGYLYEYAEYAKSARDLDSFNQNWIDSTLTFKPLESENQSVGFTTDSYWVRFSLVNEQDNTQVYYLETARAVTDLAELYQIENGKISKFKSGDNIDFESRQVPHRSTIFRIELNKSSASQFYLHFKSDGETLNLPLNLYTEAQFWKTNYDQQLFMGFFYGLILLAAIVYLFFYFSLKNSAFFYYSFYVLSIGLLQASLDGFIFQYFLSEGGFINSRIVLITALLSNFFLLKYCEHFLQVHKGNTLFYKWYRAIYLLLALLMAMLFINDSFLAIVYPISNLNGLISLLLILTTVVVMKINGKKIDPYFSIGIFFLVIGLLGFVLNNLSLVPNNFYTLNSAKFGAGFEVIFLSLSMTNLIKKLREENERSQEQALQKSLEINEMKTYFMSNISHELRTPINAILNISDLRIKNGISSEETKNFEIIKNASLSLLSNVNDILDFEKIEKNELVLRKENFNPLDLLEQISQNWKRIAEEKGLNYQFTIKNSIPNSVNGDSERFTQIINNVLSNAVKFTEAGEIQLIISNQKLNGQKAKMDICISDTGVGMEDHIKDSIFDSFNQMRLNHSRQFGGIGLGLNIVRHLVELFNGSISFKSTQGLGTDVFIELIFDIPETSDISLVNIPTNGQAEPIATADILVVEDNKLNQLVIKKVIKSYNNSNITMVENGAEAIEVLKTNLYDIILMDLQMPIMDGYEATKIIRSGCLGEQIANIPIIAVTADATEETKTKVMEIGMNDYVSKPIDAEVLFKKIEKYKITRLKIAQ